MKDNIKVDLSSVGIMTGYGSGFDFLQGQDIFLYFTESRLALWGYRWAFPEG
jgi:hypothetical protein